ncbi:nuclear transport factor 2 family protein [Chitinophaga vietnamensis]|uniref:nuclear transport factor 2 family protein n=1 Tax=Chitinophaga vietnamensis TaxID=2593957 RepID=UPI001177863E|nr:nuclear transport factor 2 family protein [Chitinophaga vietnamensis]
MLRLPLVTAIIALMIIACNDASKHEKTLTHSSTPPDSATAHADIRYRDQQQIEKVVLGFCEHFDNGTLTQCMNFMDDSIRGEIDGVRLRGKKNFEAKIEQLIASTRNTHYQPRHLLTNMQFTPGTNDTVKLSCYSSMFWTDLQTGQIQLMSIGYYKGKVVRKEDGKWYITVLNSLPDSRLVKEFYHDIPEDAAKL